LRRQIRSVRAQQEAKKAVDEQKLRELLNNQAVTSTAIRTQRAAIDRNEKYLKNLKLDYLWEAFIWEEIYGPMEYLFRQRVAIT
jgi:hypothetical protein